MCVCVNKNDNNTICFVHQWMMMLILRNNNTNEFESMLKHIITIDTRMMIWETKTELWNKSDCLKTGVCVERRFTTFPWCVADEERWNVINSITLLKWMRWMREKGGRDWFEDWEEKWLFWERDWGCDSWNENEWTWMVVVVEMDWWWFVW